jgi:hypothetical protein
MSTGRRVTASVVAARPTGDLAGITPTFEIVLEVDAGTDRARTVRIVEPVPWALAARVAPGSSVTVLIGTDPEDESVGTDSEEESIGTVSDGAVSDEAMLDWST